MFEKYIARHRKDLSTLQLQDKAWSLLNIRDQSHLCAIYVIDDYVPGPLPFFNA